MEQQEKAMKTAQMLLAHRNSYVALSHGVIFLGEGTVPVNGGDLSRLIAEGWAIEAVVSECTGIITVLSAHKS